MAAIEYRGLNAVTNFDLSRYIKSLRPRQQQSIISNNRPPNPNAGELPALEFDPNSLLGFTFPSQCSSSGPPATAPLPGPGGGDSSSSAALGLLLQSSKLQDVLERTSAADAPETPPESDRPRRCFPDDVQTYFDSTQDSGDFAESDDSIFGYLNSLFPSTIFHCELDA